MKVSEHFRRSEFACRCGCGFSAVDVELLEVLEDIRVVFDAAVIVTSGCRCWDYNHAVKGAFGSRHVKAIAADIRVKGYPSKTVADYLERKYPHKYGIGRYSTWTHIDIRKMKARWTSQ